MLLVAPATYGQAGEHASRPAGGETGATEDIADLVIAASDTESPAILEAMRASLGDLGLHVRVFRAAEAAGGPEALLQGVRARVSIDARAAERVQVIVSVPWGDRSRTVMRTVTRESSLSILVEELAYVVRSTLEALLSEPAPPAAPARSAPAASVAVQPIPAPVAPVDRPAPNGRRGGFAVDVAAFASGREIVGGATAIGAGGGLNTAPWGHAPGRTTFWVTGAFNAPFDTSNSLVTLQTEIVSLRALADVELSRLGALRLAAGGGTGMDVFRVVPLQANAPSVTLGGTTTRVDPLLASRLLALVHVAGGPSFVFAVNLDYDIEPHRYESVPIRGAPGVLLEPWRFRPSGEVGLSIPLFGRAE